MNIINFDEARANVTDYMQFGKTDLDYEKVRTLGEGTFALKVGSTTYEVSTHFNDKGTQCALAQLQELILANTLIL